MYDYTTNSISMSLHVTAGIYIYEQICGGIYACVWYIARISHCVRFAHKYAHVIYVYMRHCIYNVAPAHECDYTHIHICVRICV